MFTAADAQGRPGLALRSWAFSQGPASCFSMPANVATLGLVGRTKLSPWRATGRRRTDGTSGRNLQEEGSRRIEPSGDLSSPVSPAGGLAEYRESSHFRNGSNMLS